jgi:hypothetical protein
VNYPRSAVGAYPFATIQDVGPPRFQSYGPWINVVGADVSDVARRAAWPRTRALIHSAASEARHADATFDWGVPWTPTAYVWSLHADGTTEVVPAPSRDAALDDMRDRVSDGYSIALALFDKTSAHWPRTPVSWHLSDDPSYEGVIAQQVAKHAPHISGAGYPWGYEIVGAPAYDFTQAPNWPEIRSLIQGAINAVVSSDKIADLIAAHVLQYLVQQGFFDGRQIHPTADFLRSTDWAKIKGVIRRAVPQIVYHDEALIDAFARLLVQYGRHGVAR